MIEFRTLPNDHPDLARSPLLRAALLTLRYAQEHGAIGLTKTLAFKRVFVHWAVEHFEWPGKSAEEMFRFSKVINEYEFPPLEVLHQILISLRLGCHFKGEFRLTKRGAELADALHASAAVSRTHHRPIRHRPVQLLSQGRTEKQQQLKAVVVQFRRQRPRQTSLAKSHQIVPDGSLAKPEGPGNSPVAHLLDELQS